MRPWLKKTSIRFAIILLLIIILAAAVTWWPSHRAKQAIVQQEALSAQTAAQLKQAEVYLDDLPALDANNIRKQGAIKFYADQVKRISGQFNKLTLLRPPDLRSLFGIATNGKYRIIKDFNFTLSQTHQKTVYTNSRNDIVTADKLMAYHAAIAKALINILEYDPVADTQGFDLKSAGTQQRLTLARDGLTKIDQQLQQAKKLYSDPSINEVTAIISGLRHDGNQLSQTGDTSAWITAVEDAQSKIIQNRINFWSQASGSIKFKLAEDQSQMTSINNIWEKQAAKYNLSN